MIVRREQKKLMEQRVLRASNVELWTSDVAHTDHLSFHELQGLSFTECTKSDDDL